MRAVGVSAAGAVPRQEYSIGDGWRGLPAHLLEDVLQAVMQSSEKLPLQDLFAACGVCKSWRQLGVHQFFEQPWDACPYIVHPMQLFSLSPRSVDGGLLKCFVVRERLRMGSVRFCMYLGTQSDSPATAKFLLAALQTSRMLAPLPAGGIRWETSIYLNKQCEGKPVARLSASLLSTRYTLKPTTSCMPTTCGPASGSDGMLRSTAAQASEVVVTEGLKPGFWRRKRAVADVSLKAAEAAAAAAGVPANLADVQYSKRVQGFMRPRKIRVALPHPSELACFEPRPGHSSRLAAMLGGPARASSGLDEGFGVAADKELQRSGGMRRLSLLESLRCSTAVAGDLAMGSAASLDGPLPDLALLQQAELETSSARPPLMLQNKLPRWNEGLRCWCLNFRSRVKLASVKNFQLQCCDADMAEELAAAALPAPELREGDAPMTRERRLRQVVMQFGKVCPDTYILDYNPTITTALQAFSIALSTFDGKLRF